jgi:hypothetical protein
LGRRIYDLRTRSIEGYETLLASRTELFPAVNFVPMGDPDKAAKVMVDLVETSEPPMHLVLGSEAIGMLRNADAQRAAEMEKWLRVSISTDHDEAENFLETDAGKFFLKERSK